MIPEPSCLETHNSRPVLDSSGDTEFDELICRTVHLAFGHCTGADAEAIYADASLFREQMSRRRRLLAKWPLA